MQRLQTYKKHFLKRAEIKRQQTKIKVKIDGSGPLSKSDLESIRSGKGPFRDAFPDQIWKGSPGEIAATCSESQWM